MKKNVYILSFVFSFLIFIPNTFARSSIAIYEKTPHKLGTNCVFWARTVEKRLPQGLFSQKDKTKYINTHEPYLGAVAVTDESVAGHVAIVRGADETHILIEEANYIAGYVTLRAVPQKNILGYILLDEQVEEDLPKKDILLPIV